MLTDILAILAAVVSAVAVIIVGYLANSLHRQLKRGVQDRQLDAYEGLWAVTGAAATIRLKGDWAGGVLSEDERQKLFHAMTHWYYGSSGGIYLSPRARSLYLRAKENLLCPKEEIQPDGALKEFAHVHDINEQRGLLSIHQLSLLRWVMRFDLAIRTEPYITQLMPKEMKLLKDCNIDLYKAPFKGNWTAAKPGAGSEESGPALNEEQPEPGLAL